jgi:hypothetical protein
VIPTKHKDERSLTGVQAQRIADVICLDEWMELTRISEHDVPRFSFSAVSLSALFPAGV